MKNIIISAALLAASTTAVLAQARQDFVLVNRTGYTISEVYVSPSKTNDWEEDVLGDDELDEGESQRIKFNRSTRSCMWDLKVVYSDDNSASYWRDINLCEVSKITVRYNRRAGTTTATFD